MGADLKIPINLQLILLAVTILVSTFPITSNGSSYESVSPFADRSLEDLLEKYANIDQQHFWHPNSFNTGLQSREVIRISSVSKQSIPGIYKQWKTAHLGPSTVFAGLTPNGIALLDEYFNEIAFIRASEELVALTMFSAWDDDRSLSELVIITASVKASLHSYSFANGTVMHLGTWPLHHPVKSLELCTVDLTKKIIVVPQDPRGSVDIYNFQVEGNSSELWFFQSLKLDKRTCLVVHDADSTCSIAYAAERNIGLITYDPHGRLFHEQSIKNVSSPCKQLASFSLAYSQYLAFVPKGSNHTVQFITDTGKGQLYQNSVPIQALEIIPLPGSDNREDILLVRTPENTTKLYSYDGYGKLFKETFSCPLDICSHALGENLSNGASTLANGTTTVFLTPTQRNKTEATVLLIQSVIEDYPSPLFERARQQYNEFESLAELYKRFQQTVMATRSALDDALDRSGSNVITGNWSIKELTSYNVMMSDDNPASNNRKETFQANFGTIEFNESPLKYEDFLIQDTMIQTELGRFRDLVYQAKHDVKQTVPLESTEVIEVRQPQNIDSNVQSSTIESQNLQVHIINDVDRPQEFFNGLAQYHHSSPSGLHINRSITFQGYVRTSNINTNYINGIPTQLLAFSSANNVFNTPIVLQNETYAKSNVTAHKVSGLRIPQDVILASNIKGVTFTGTLIAKIEAFIKSLVGGVSIDKSLEQNVLLDGPDQAISSTIEFDTIVLRNLSSIKYLNGQSLSEVIKSIVLKNHQGLIRGTKTILYTDVTANSLTIRDTLNSIPFPSGYIRKGETDVITYGTKSFLNVTVDKATVDGSIDGVKTDQIVRLDSSHRRNDHANWTLYGPTTFEGDIHVTGHIGGIHASQLGKEDLSHFTNNSLYQPDRHIVIENPVIVDKLNAEHKVNGGTYNETFGDVLSCQPNQPMVVKGLTTFQNGVKLGQTQVQTNAVNGQHFHNFLSRHKEQNITKNFVFNKTVNFSELVALGTIDGIWLKDALEDIIFLDKINTSSKLTFDSLRAESQLTVLGPVNDFNNFGSDVAVKRGRASQTFENSLYVKQLKAKNLYADIFNTTGSINGWDIDQWHQDRVTLSQDRTWNYPVEINGEAIFKHNVDSKTINGESLLFLEKGVLRKNGGHQTFSSPVVINGLILARGQVRIHKTLNGYSLTDVIRDSIPVDSYHPENITTAWKLEKAVFEKLTVKGKTCGVNLEQLVFDSVRKNSTNVHFLGNTTFLQDVEVSGKLRTALVNTGNMNTSFFTLHTAQEVQSDFRWKKDIQVDGIFNVAGKINNISLEDLRRLYSFYNNIHHVNSSVIFDATFDSKHLEVEGFIQSRYLNQFLSSVVWLNSPSVQSVHGDLSFTQLFVSEANIECDTVNGIDVSELALHLVPKNTGFVFNKQVCFTKPVQTDVLFVESGNVKTTTGIVGDVNIEDLKHNSVPINSPNPLLLEEMSFENIIIKGSLEGVKYINGIPIQDFLTRNTPQNMTSLRVTHLRVLQKNINVKGLFGGVNVNEAYEDTVLVTTQDGIITGAKSFTGAVKILGNLKTDGKLTSSLVMMNGTNFIQSPTVFEDDVIVTGNMILLGKWNNYNLSDMQQHGVSKYGDEVIKTRWNFPRGLVLKNDTSSYGLVDGINMTSVHQESRKKVREMEHSLSGENQEFNEICHTYQRLYDETERSPLKLQSFDEQQVILTKHKVTNMITVEVGASLFLLVTSDTCGVYVYKWSTQKEEFHEFALALADESIDKWVRSSSHNAAIIVFSTLPSKCGTRAEVGLYFTVPNASGNFSARNLISSGTVVDFKLVSDKMEGELLFVVFSETPEAVVVYSWNNSNYDFVLEASLNISTFIRTLDVNKLRNGDVEILLQTVFRVSIAVYSTSQKSLKEIGHADFYGSSKSMALFRADKSLYALVSTRETSKTAIKPDSNLQLFLATRGELQFLQKLTIYDLVAMEVVRVGNQVYVLVLTKPVGLYIYKFMGLSGLQTVSVHPLKFHHGEHLASFEVTPWHYDTPLPFVLISNGKMIKLFHSNVIGNAVIKSENNPTHICHASQ